MYRLLPTTPPSSSRHYYPRLISGTNLPTPKGWIAWWVRVQCTYAHKLCPRLLHNWIPMHEKEMSLCCRTQDQLNTNVPNARHVKARGINIWTCWATVESNSRSYAPAAQPLSYRDLLVSFDIIRIDIHWYQLISFDIIRYHSISFDIIRYHSISFDIIWYHSISFDNIHYFVYCLFQEDVNYS